MAISILYSNLSLHYNLQIFQPSLKNYQEKNSPEYIQRKNKESLIASGKFKRDADEPETKKIKRHGSVEPLERSMTESPLPELPESLQQKKVTSMGYLKFYYCVKRYL